jgi:predicted DNA-binding WGR domain protein
MRLLKQVILFFKEGNSDKVYEIDLCDMGNEQYVVNFRYGRRGTVLKEGSKTETPVSRSKADSIFDALEAEKRAKGYRAAGESSMPVTSTPDTIVTVQIPVINWHEWPEGRAKAILQRLQRALEGKENSASHPWKTSRVIWMAGVMKIEAAAPLIINLAGKGDGMQQYAVAWALGRLGNEDAIPLLQSYFKSASGSHLKRVAGESLLSLLKGEERTKHLQHFTNSLPEPVKLAVENNQPEKLQELLLERIVSQQQQQYIMLEDLYAIAVEHKWIKQLLKNILLQLPSQPSYFRHIRHIYKLGELRDDFEMLGALSCKFEREQEMFTQTKNSDDNGEVYISSLEEYVETSKELSKKTSRIAYSDRTRQYLRGRTLRNLINYGKYNDLNYVKMATGLLLAYDQERDYSKPFTTSSYENVNGRYQQVQNQFPASAHAVYLNQVFFGNAKNWRLLPKNLWVISDKQSTKSVVKKSNPQPGNQEQGGGILKKIFSLFGGKKKEAPAPLPETESVIRTATPPPVTQQHNDAPNIHLWNKLPQAYVQLLIHARMNDIHRFALSNLQSHPEYNAIKEKLDHHAIELLLISPYDIPVNFGYNLALEKYNPQQPDTGLVKALLYSRLPLARETATKWVNDNPDPFFDDSEWVSALLFCPHAEVRKWVTEKMMSRSYTPVQAQLICGRVIAAALAARPATADNTVIEEAGETIIRLFSASLNEISLNVTEDLVKSIVPATQLLGLKILLLKKGKINYDTLSSDVFYLLLNNTSQSVRDKTFELLQELSIKELLKRQELVIHCCVSSYHDVRVNIRPILKRMADEDAGFGTNAVNWLMPYLLRKENSEGLQKDVSDTLIQDLIVFINNADKEMVLRLVYSQYIPAQEFGIAILEKYIDPATFTIRQIIALGNHETLSVRQWCWKYFSANVARIKFEREEAIRLLDTQWDDTREFAKQFFKDNFSANDWSPETLVGIADSVRPDIEAYGRELITRFFEDKEGENYLLKLSQHPGEKMQLFATNYLERFASGNMERMGSLVFYFRSVLSRVNKARTAKNRVFQFLLKEGKQSEEAAKLVANIISNVSATVSIDDKAKCIEIMYELNKLYKLDMPIIIHPVEERV